MKKSLKLLSVFLCFVLVLCSFSVAANADSKPKDNLKVTVTTNKESYGLFEKPVITLTVENKGNVAVSGVRAGISGGNYLPLKGSRINCSAAVLMPGQTCSVSFTAVLSPETKGLSFIGSILLKFRNLFVKTDIIPLTGISPEYAVYTNTKTTHGKVNASISAYAVCGDALTVAEGEDAAELLSLYNSAVINTNENGDVTGTQRLAVNDIKAGGSMGKIIETALPVIESTLKNTQGEQSGVPGKGLLTTDDIEAIASVKDEESTKIIIKVKDQLDGFNADGENGGPVSRAIETLGSISAAFEALGAEVKSGAETLSLNYNDAYIICEIDNDGFITGGTWHYNVDMSIGNMTADMQGINLSFKDLSANMDWFVEI